ncbi:hypothetical protein IJI99_02830 [bacterium]|nr:hypothetical protein [bacterium]
MKQIIYILKRYYHFFKTGLRGALAAAQYHHPERELTIILVTGTDGKTTTSTLIYQLLKSADYPVALLSTVAAYIGDKALDTGFHVTSPQPQDLYKFMRQMVDAGMKYLVLEMTSQGAYQWRNWGIKAKVAALTNIDREHLDYHLNYDNYLAAKMLVLNSAQVAVANSEQDCFSQVKKQLKPDVKLIPFNKQTKFGKKIDAAIKAKFPQAYNQLNAILAVTVAQQFKISDQQIVSGLKDFKLPAGRLELVPNKLGINMIVDFAHTPQALAAVLPEIRRQYVKKGGQLIGIVGCAGLRDHLKRPAMGRIMAENYDIAIFTAEDPRTENIWSIIAQMKQDLGEYHSRVISIANRREALFFVLRKFGHAGSTIAIFGKGHEQSMNYDGKTETPWNDIEQAGIMMRFLEKKNADKK